MRSSSRVAFIAICLAILSLLTWSNFTSVSSSFDHYLLRIHNGDNVDAVDLVEQIWSADAEKAVVMAKMEKEDTDWVAQNLPDWHHVLYHMDAPAPNSTLTVHHYTPPLNKGREAMAYLTFLIDHYHALPETIVFLHSHRKGWPAGWHTDASNYDNVNSLRALRIDHVQKEGYANLRCLYNPGCPDEIQPFRDPKDETRTSELAMQEAWEYMFADPTEADSASSAGDEPSSTVHRRLFFDSDPTILDTTTAADSNTYLTTSPSVPKVIAAACCSQFAVSRAQVLQRPLAAYKRYRQWLIDTPLDDDVSGRVLEYLWHVFFGKEPVQ